MPQIKIPSLVLGLLLSLSLATLSGCGDKNPQADFSSITGKHPALWLPNGHAAAAKSDLESCIGCHGQDLKGGISKVSCVTCHTDAPDINIHPLIWGNYAYARHSAYVAVNGTDLCKQCHGADLNGVPGSTPSCVNACHLGGAASFHPAAWTNPVADHKAYLNGINNITTSCKTATCHGTDGKGVFLSGPACDQCHSMK